MRQFADVMIRATDEPTFYQVAVQIGLIVVTSDGPEPVPGADVDVIGPVVIVPAVIDADGIETTPAVFDPRYHVNLRIDPGVLPGWTDLLSEWMAGGRPEPSNKAEAAQEFRGVALITGGVKTPQRVWAGDRQ